MEPTTTTSRFKLYVSIALNVFLLGLFYSSSGLESPLLRRRTNIVSLPSGTQQQQQSETTRANVVGWERPPVIYGLLHMAKTAGSEINGELANHFERVCGNKGYSYDALEHNNRVEQVKPLLRPGEKATKKDLGESISRLYKGRNRGHPPFEWMEEIGFDDCDYVAMETLTMKHWTGLAESQGPLELHVPCRDPLEHLMSMCNYQKKEFRCDGQDLRSEIKTCALFLNRFQPRLMKDPNIALKCFDSVPPKRYIDSMGQILQRKRVESDYVHRATNRPRNRTRECIWDQDVGFQNRVRKIMLDTYPYYQFCESCLGSEHDLLRS